jgi:hypothetical protein
MAVAGKVDCQRRFTQADDDGVPRVCVLAAAVQKDDPWGSAAPAQRTDAAIRRVHSIRATSGSGPATPAYAVCTYRSAKGKTAEYRATVADVVYKGIVDVLKAPDGDRFIVIGEHSPDNLIYDPTSSAGIDRLTSS